jgi:hypothetical protein
MAINPGSSDTTMENNGLIWPVRFNDIVDTHWWFEIIGGDRWPNVFAEPPRMNLFQATTQSQSWGHDMDTNLFGLYQYPRFNNETKLKLQEFERFPQIPLPCSVWGIDLVISW